MTWLWVLGILLFLLFLLSMVRVGARAEMKDGELVLDVKLGPALIRVLPQKKMQLSPEKEAAKAAKAAKAAAKKEAKKEAQKTAKAAQKEARKGEKLSVKTARVKELLGDIRSAVDAIWPPLQRALNRTRKAVRIHPLQLALTVGAEEDPAMGAQVYGYIHAGVWTVMPLLEKVLDIPEPYIHVGLDFESPDTKVEGEAGLSIRLGTLLKVGLTVAVPALRWFLKWNKKQKQQQTAETTKKGS